MHTVVETNAYIKAAKNAGMSDGEMSDIVSILAFNPTAGDMMTGCGGARKLRVAKPGTGKSGGYRIVTYYGGDHIPVFLLTAFGKNEKVNLSQSERNILASLVKLLRDGCR